MSQKRDYILISMIQATKKGFQVQIFGQSLSQMETQEKIVQLLALICTIFMTIFVVHCIVEFAILAQCLFSPSEVCVQNQDLIFIMVGMVSYLEMVRYFLEDFQNPQCFGMLKT